MEETKANVNQQKGKELLKKLLKFHLNASVEKAGGFSERQYDSEKFQKKYCTFF